MARRLRPVAASASRCWLVVAISLALAAVTLWFAPRDWLDWQPGLALAQPWRLWSAAFVHWSALHLGANLLGCAVLAAFGVAADVPRAATWAWLAAWPLTHAALGLQPQLLAYGGLSGVLHAGVAIVALHLVWRERGRRRAIGWAVLVGLAVKLTLERPWAGPTLVLPGWDIRLAPLAHVAGTVAGLLCGAVAQLTPPRRSARA